jgi:hypothetical protein
VRQGAWVFLDSAKKEVSRKVAGEDGKKSKTITSIEPFCPSLAQVSATFDALKAVAGVKGVAPPCWLPGYKGPEAREVVSLADGLLHVPSRQLLPHTPGFFTVNTRLRGDLEARQKIGIQRGVVGHPVRVAVFFHAGVVGLNSHVSAPCLRKDCSLSLHPDARSQNHA